MAEHAQTWVFKRLKSLWAIWKGRIMDVIFSGRILNSTQMTVRVDHFALAIFQRLLELGIQADRKLKVPTDGFANIYPSSTTVVAATEEQLTQEYVESEERRVRDHTSRFNEALRAQSARRQHEHPQFSEQILVLFDREFAHITLQPQVDEYPTSPSSEPWILNTKRMPATERFGFVAYRVYYKDSDQEWAAFLRKLNAGMGTWSGIAGSDDVKERATLHWIDRRRENIPEGDLEAVRR
jgi:hypothetical protein